MTCAVKHFYHCFLFFLAVYLEGYCEKFMRMCIRTLARIFVAWCSGFHTLIYDDKEKWEWLLGMKIGNMFEFGEFEAAKWFLHWWLTSCILDAIFRDPSIL